MFGRRQTSDHNASVAVVPVYGVDPRGAAIFAGAVNGTVGHLGSRVVMDARSSDWHGWTQQPQHFYTAAQITGANSGRPRVDTTTYLDQSRSSAELSPMQALMEARAARGRS